MALRQHIKIGDIYEIPLPDKRYAYAQHVNRNAEYGYLIRVFNQIVTVPMRDIDQLDESQLLFPPVFVGLRATVSSGRWKRIGNKPVNTFTFPLFRQTIGTKPGTYSDWRIWDGVLTKKVGALPVSYRSLELECVWGDEGLEERIVAGTYRGDSMY